ncbi:hypothetical protein XENORESO_012840 [Xenotaenia resolanae]|uniref:Transposase n=1 Tax=Xenotaenia resolanae TaxID=208358 RepID=A0ABV0VLV7_9TELE
MPLAPETKLNTQAVVTDMQGFSALTLLLVYSGHRVFPCRKRRCSFKHRANQPCISITKATIKSSFIWPDGFTHVQPQRQIVLLSFPLFFTKVELNSGKLLERSNL